MSICGATRDLWRGLCPKSGNLSFGSMGIVARVLFAAFLLCHQSTALGLVATLSSQLNATIKVAHFIYQSS